MRIGLHGARSRAARGFTLFEVAISLAVVALAVVSVLMLFPMGIKAQQIARFQLYAAAKAEEMVESFNTTHNANPAIDTEAFKAWDVPVSYRSQAWDLEHRLSSHRFGIMPLPMEIAARLDSDNDEIQKILAEGGYLYYSQPLATTNLEEEGLRGLPPNEAQKVVFAVTGYAQNNSLHILAQKNWPYVTPYPSPPFHGLHHREFLPADATTFYFPDPMGGDANSRHVYAWEEASDPDMRKVFHWEETGSDKGFYGFRPYAYGLSGNNGLGGPLFVGGEAPSRASAIRYVQAALWYCKRKGLDPTFWNPAAIPDPVPDFEPSTPVKERWKQVQAMRFLSHAATCLTRWYDFAELNGTGAPIPRVTLDGETSPESFNITHAMIVYYHERCMNLIMKYSASYPYDWSAPRPLQRTIMMDFPLLEYDLFAPPQTGHIFDRNDGNSLTWGPPAAQWKPIPGQPIHNGGTAPVSGTISGMAYANSDGNPGYGFQFPTHPVPGPENTAFWGDASRFTLAKPFVGAERCRQLVFWAVDWQAYEDAELAPSAPVDASKYPFLAPKDNITWNQRMDSEFRDEQLYAYRNPEKVMLFKQDVSGRADGDSVEDVMLLNRPWITQPDQGSGADRKRVFSGRWGADRNFNRKLDKVGLPKSIRMRAVQVARFNFYDPRVPAVVR